MMRAFIAVGCLLMAGCTKQVGLDPEHGFTDAALYDSCKANEHRYRHDTLYSGQFGPHGNFKLSFSSVAFHALNDTGGLNGKKFPAGSMIIKRVYRNGTPSVFAFMYKRNGSWLWGQSDGSNVTHSVKSDGAYCIRCHTGPHSSDGVLTLGLY